MKEDLKQLFLEESANTIIDKLITVIPERELKKILNPVIVNAEIVDIEKVISYIITIWPFNTKDIEINLQNQTLDFKIYGKCYVPKDYSIFRVMEDNYSLVPTEENDTFHEIEEKYAEEQSINLIDVPGIKINFA